MNRKLLFILYLIGPSLAAVMSQGFHISEPIAIAIGLAAVAIFAGVTAAIWRSYQPILTAFVAVAIGTVAALLALVPHQLFSSDHASATGTPPSGLPAGVIAVMLLLVVLVAVAAFIFGGLAALAALVAAKIISRSTISKEVASAGIGMVATLMASTLSAIATVLAVIIANK